jgi:CheY-like chemotaxis protein
MEPTLDLTTELPPVVMVVDADADALEMYQELLSSAGLWATGTTRIDEAFEFAVDLQPDAIVADLVFNKDIQPGVEFIRQLKTAPKLSSVPIILVLNSRTADGVLEDLPVQASLKKPVAPVRLLDQIQAVLDTSRALRQRTSR